MAIEYVDVLEPRWLPTARRFTFVALLVVLLTTLTTAAAARATRRDVAVPAIAVGMESLLSPGEADMTNAMRLAQELGYEEELPWLGFTSDRSAPVDAVYPVEGLSFSVGASEIEGMGEAEAADLYFTRMADEMYASEGAGVLALADDPALKERITSGSAPLVPLFAQSHETLGWVTGVLVLLTMGVFIFFISVRSGHRRLWDASLALVAASLAGIVILAFSTSMVAFGSAVDSMTPNLSETADPAARIGFVAAEIVAPLENAADDVFLIAALIGIAAMVGAMFWRRATHQGSALPVTLIPGA